MVAVLGPQGTFSEKAAYKLNIPKEDITYCPSINECFKMLDRMDIIVPIENTLDGYVQETLDLLLEYHAVILKEIYVPVQFSLVGNVSNINELKRVYVQFKAKRQCQNFFDEHPFCQVINTESNIESLNLAKAKKPGDGAIIPLHSLDDFFSFRINNVTDSVNNETRFLYLGKDSNKKYFNENHNKCTLAVEALVDKPGLLYNVLGVLKDHDLNMISLMSRPTKKTMGNYYFFIEIAMNGKNDSEIKKCLPLVNNDEVKTTILGIY